MPKVKNIAPGPRGAWQGATLVMAEPGQVIEAEDFAPEWFEEVDAPKPAPAPRAKVKAPPKNKDAD